MRGSVPGRLSLLTFRFSPLPLCAHPPSPSAPEQGSRLSIRRNRDSGEPGKVAKEGWREEVQERMPHQNGAVLLMLYILIIVLIILSLCYIVPYHIRG